MGGGNRERWTQNPGRGTCRESHCKLKKALRSTPAIPHPPTFLEGWVADLGKFLAWDPGMLLPAGWASSQTQHSLDPGTTWLGQTAALLPGQCTETH